MKQSYGAAYSPRALADLEAGIDAPFSDGSEIFISGLLRDDKSRRWGTCSSIPVLVTAIARRLGYPVRLACARQHLYCRWESDDAIFNIEASNPMGMAVLPDDHYRQLRGGFSADEDGAGFHFRSLSPAEEFACFMQDRVAVLQDAGRLDETLFWSARALQFSPDNWVFAREAYHLCNYTLRGQLRQHNRGEPVDMPLDHRVYDTVPPHQRSFVATIVGHYFESLGHDVAAREAYEESCRRNIHGLNEQRDLRRFVNKRQNVQEALTR